MLCKCPEWLLLAAANRGHMLCGLHQHARGRDQLQKLVGAAHCSSGADSVIDLSQADATQSNTGGLSANHQTGCELVMRMTQGPDGCATCFHLNRQLLCIQDYAWL